MKILITAGGTREYIDDVRVLTNISTGKLSANIADELMINHRVTYVYATGAELPKLMNSVQVNLIRVNSVSDLMKVMEQEIPKNDIVIHAMAVSDFGFKSISEKLKSSDPIAFVESLKDRIIVNPKVISYFKTWNPNIKIISFKFEVGKTFDELFQIAYDSLERNGCDHVIANDKQEMVSNGTHIAYVINKDKTYFRCRSKQEIANYIRTNLIK